MGDAVQRDSFVGRGYTAVTTFLDDEERGEQLADRRTRATGRTFARSGPLTIGKM